MGKTSNRLNEFIAWAEIVMRQKPHRLIRRTSASYMGVKYGGGFHKGAWFETWKQFSYDVTNSIVSDDEMMTYVDCDDKFLTP